MMEFTEFCKQFHPDIIQEYERFITNDVILPIGTKVITNRAGFGGSGNDHRVIRGYYTNENFKFTTSPAKASAYCLGYSIEQGAFVSYFENAWKDFRLDDSKK